MSESYESLVRAAHGVSQNNFHLIWCTKWRQPLFASLGMRRVAINAIRQAADRHGIHIYRLEVMSDHVHLFARLPRDMHVSRAFQLLKGGSSHHIRAFQPWRRNYKALWSPFTFSRTVGSVTGGVIDHYIHESNTRGQYGLQKSLKEY